MPQGATAEELTPATNTIAIFDSGRNATIKGSEIKITDIPTKASTVALQLCAGVTSNILGDKYYPAGTKTTDQTQEVVLPLLDENTIESSKIGLIKLKDGHIPDQLLPTTQTSELRSIAIGPNTENRK